MSSYIPNSNPRESRYIPKSKEERIYTHTFQSLTDLWDPKEMYDRNIIKEATGGQNILDEHIERLQRLIEARGNYVFLVKRILDGDYCSCYNPISKEVMRKYCLECYGTRISGGYRLFYNKDRVDGKIIISQPFADESISMEEWGRDWKEELEGWTLPWIPLENGSTTFSYDFIIKYNEDGTELGRYYITSVKPSRAIGNKVTYQRFSMRLADKPTYEIGRNGEKIISRRGDIIYEVDINKLDKVFGGKP